MLRTFRLSTGAFLNANYVQEKLAINYAMSLQKEKQTTRSDSHVLSKRREKDLEFNFKSDFNC